MTECASSESTKFFIRNLQKPFKNLRSIQLGIKAGFPGSQSRIPKYRKQAEKKKGKWKTENHDWEQSRLSLSDSHRPTWGKLLPVSLLAQRSLLVTVNLLT